jgi:hypothetical protein
MRRQPSRWRGHDDLLSRMPGVRVTGGKKIRLLAKIVDNR